MRLEAVGPTYARLAAACRSGLAITPVLTSGSSDISPVKESRSGVPKGVQYLALLRGINVGGKSLIKMADLREAFEGMGFDEVATYIASGNVLFRAPRQSRETLAERIESELTKRFGMEIRVVLLTEAQLKGVIDGAPRGFGGDKHLCDVIFLRQPLSASKAFGLVDPKEGVDRAWRGKGVLYFSRLAAKASSSRLSRVASMPEYKNMTIRSWNTARKLLALLDSRNAG